MSEPMTNIEIEDVLSSIRRLVSEDAPRPTAPPRPMPLMLTPAFRVSAPKPARPGNPSAAVSAPVAAVSAPAAAVTRSRAAAVSRPGAPADPAPAPEVAIAAPAATQMPLDALAPMNDAFHFNEPTPAEAAEAAGSLERRIADLEAAISRSAEEFEPDGSEDQSEHVPGSVLRTAHWAPGGSAPEDKGEAGAQAPVDAAWSSGDDAVAEAEPNDAPALAPADAGASAETFAGEPCRDAAGETAAVEAGTSAAVTEATRGDDAGVEDLGVADVAAEGNPGADTGPDAPETGRIEASAALDPAPDEVTEAESLEADAWEIEPEPAIRDLPGNQSSGFAEDLEIEPETAAGVEVEETLIDEDSLRDIVAELIRQELRGELGEKITRNVRRLIRREVHRALALQDLEDDEG